MPHRKPRESRAVRKPFGANAATMQRLALNVNVNARRTGVYARMLRCLHRRLLDPIGHWPPAKAEAAYHRQREHAVFAV